MNFSRKFVCEDRAYSTYERNVPAPLFRKRFEITDVEKAEILICGLGFYDLFVNGKKITKGYLAPYISNTDHVLCYDRYDIAPYLTEGENVIGIMLGDGHLVGKTCIWDFKDNITNAAPMVALSARIQTAEGTLSFEADGFVCTKGPILFNDLRSGVFYDARLEDNWLLPGYDDSHWHAPIQAVRPRGYAKICEAEPIRVRREIAPVSITKGQRETYVPSGQMDAFLKELTPFEKPVPCDGGYIYDFGENNSGIYRLKIRGARGQKIDIQCAEQLTDGKVNYSNINFYPDGFSQRDIYYLKGEGEEVFEPMFTFHGYRYIYICGITEEQATPELLTYLTMSSDLEERGTFECSDEMANTIYQMGRRSDISNFYYFPMDCPHREKNGWLGDASVSAEHMIMTVGPENSWREWLNTVRRAQREDGCMPGCVPVDNWGYEWISGPAWESVIFTLPYFAWQYRGRTDLIRENADAMLRYLAYVAKKRDERGVVVTGLGDWVPVNRSCSDYESDLGFTNGVMILDMCAKATAMFEKVGLLLHKDFARRLGDEMLQTLRTVYIDFDTYVVRNRCQTSQAMAIFYNVFREEEKERAFAVLMDILREDNCKLTCGFLGTRVLYHVLARFGQGELAYEMITGTEFPSYGNWVSRGETTFLEQFMEYGTYYPSSKNHHFLGDVVNWFMRHPGGLHVIDHNTVKVSPIFISRLDWCRVSHKLPGGDIEIFWERKEKEITLQVRTSGTVQYRVELAAPFTYEMSAADVYRILPNN